MKREIKFRGKQIEGGRWIYGSFCQWTDMLKAEHFEILDNYGYRTTVDPATVGQYTGVEDEKGSEIFDSDVLSTSDTREIHKCPLQVYWDYDRWYAKDRDGQDYDNGDYYQGDQIEWHQFTVVGNIHDNPELLAPKGEATGQEKA